MKQTIVLYLVFAAKLALASTSDHTTSRLSMSERNCLLNNPLEMGASITAETPYQLGVYNAITSLVLGAKSNSYQGSPDRLFVDYYRSGVPLDPNADYSGQGPKNGPWRMNSTATRFPSATGVGSAQVDSVLNGSNNKYWKQAGVVMGIDLFYWDAVWDTCGKGQPLYSQQTGQRADVEYRISQLIDAAKRDHKVLVLGTVPHDDPSKVLIDSDRLGVPGLWYPPKAPCVDSINSQITSLCKTESNCYVVDLDGLVKNLYAGNSVQLWSGKKLGLYDLRPDGVHLSKDGSKFVSEQMIDAVEAGSASICQKAAIASPVEDQAPASTQ